MNHRAVWVLVLLLVVSAGCAAPVEPSGSRFAPSEGAGGAGGPSETSGYPRGTLKVAWNFEPDNLSPKMISRTGGGEFNWVFNSTLTYYDLLGGPHPMIAREIPSRDRGDWVINADGTMVTTYRLRENARWHDATPLTAHDFVFAYQVYVDAEVPVVRREPELLMSSVEALNDFTLVIRWKEPYVRANLLGYEQLLPLPRHVFEQKYSTNKASLLIGEEWATAYVGTGPFRVERWTPGVGVLARAHRDWVLGPPKIEVLDIRFISDSSTLLANLLAGEVDLVNSPGVRVPEALVARDQWVVAGHGYLKTWETTMNFLEFQYREVPNWQSAVADVRVRQALTHSLDRQNLAETVTEGLGNPAETFVLRTDPLYPEIERALRKYPFDPNRAARAFADAGWARAQPGGPLVSASGQPLDIEVMSGVGQQRAATIIADHWKQAGVTTTVFILPVARERDRLFRASFPATQLNGRGVSLDNFHWVSSHLPTPESGFVGLNRGSFQDDEVDRLHQIGRTSFDANVQREAIIALHKRTSELAAYVPLLFQVEVILAKHKVKGPVGNYAPQSGITWNVFEWEVTGAG